jgi:MoaA/NifB/PqqE/SkfB family radical SAM enzyme
MRGKGERMTEQDGSPKGSALRQQLDAYRLPTRVRLLNFMQNVSYSASLRKPWLIARLVGNTIKGSISRRRQRQIEIAIDYRCNLKCPHCSSKLLVRPDRKAMELDDYRELARQTKEMGIVSYIFTGGEPLSFLDRLLEIIPIFEPHRNLITLQSNALLLNEHVAARLHKAGVDNIFVSVDSFHLEDGRGAIDLNKIGGIIDLIRKHDMNVLVCTVISHANIRSMMLPRMIDFFSRKRVILFFNVAIPIGAWRESDDVVLTEEDQLLLRDLTKKHPFTRFDFATNFGGFGCPAFKERLYITPYGDILGCPFLQISFGNIADGDDLSAVRATAMKSRYFNHYHKFCLAGEDAEFMRFYIPRYNSSDKLPIPYRSIEEYLVSSASRKEE